MNAEETHRKVLELTGFEVTCTPEAKAYRLNRNNELASKWGVFGFATEADAWAQAPTLETLMPKLVEAMVNGDTPYFIGYLDVADGAWKCQIRGGDWGGDFIHRSDATTMAHAIGAVFVKMCEESLIDPKAMTL